MKWLSVLILLLGIDCLRGQPAQIIIIRHGEETPSNSVHLSARGQQRAEALAFFFTTNGIARRHGSPVALFAPHPTLHGSKRSEETLFPTSRRLHVPIQGTFAQQQYWALAQSLLHNRRYRGKTVVIAWIHTWIPRMIAALGVRPMPPPINSTVYDRLYVIAYGTNGVTFRNLPQHLLPGDSPQ